MIGAAHVCRIPVPLVSGLVLLAFACASNPPRTLSESTTRPAENQSLIAAPDQFFNHDEQRIRYRELGQGDPVVMLHGRGGLLEAWRWLADSLTADYRVIAIDQRGHGQSTRPVTPALYGPAMARDVVALLDHLHIPRAHVVGFSLGAVVAAHVAANFPDRVRTASLLAGPFYADSAATAQATADYITEMESGRGRRESLRRLGLSDSAITVVNARMLANSNPAALLAMTRAMGNLMIVPERRSTIRVPALVAVGTADGLLDNSRWLASWWPGAHLVEVPGATHGSILQRPEVLSAIRELLRAERSRER